MPGEKSMSISSEEMLGGGSGGSPPGSPLISSEEEDIEPNEVAGACSSSSPSVVAKTKKARKRNTESLKGSRPFTKRYKYAKIHTDRCQRMIRFLKQQSRLTGLPIANIVSQSLSRRQVGEVVQLQLEGVAYNPNPDEPSGLMPDVKEEVKEEPHEDEETTGSSSTGSTATPATATEPQGESEDDGEMHNDALESGLLDDNIRQWSEDKVNKLVRKVSSGMETLPILIKELRSARMSAEADTNMAFQVHFEEALKAEKVAYKEILEQLQVSQKSIDAEKQANADLEDKLKRMKQELVNFQSKLVTTERRLEVSEKEKQKEISAAREADAILKKQMEKMKEDRENAKLEARTLCRDLVTADAKISELEKTAQKTQLEIEATRAQAQSLEAKWEEEFMKMSNVNQENENAIREAEKQINTEIQANTALQKQLKEMKDEQNLTEGSWSKTTGLTKAHAMALEEKWRAKFHIEVLKVKQEYETEASYWKKETQETNSANKALEEQLKKMKEEQELEIDKFKKMREERDFAKAALVKANSTNSQFRARYESAERKLRNSEQKQESGEIDLRLMLNEYKNDQVKKIKKVRHSTEAAFEEDISENNLFEETSDITNFEDDLAETAVLMKINAKRGRMTSAQRKQRFIFEENESPDLTDLRQILQGDKSG